MTQDPNLAKIELIAGALGPLRDRLVFVGGCAVGLLITDTAAAPVRITFDVDLVARVSALAAYHGIEKEFVSLGFTRDTTSDAPVLPALIFPDESLAERTQVVTERIRLLAKQCTDKS